ncbi:heme biosynthesis HemY N-terminal domain-containing protein [Magnetospirillum sp. UT-4]|uniref:heme biosynthesis HemY N-terminal domain-containing protein n=1 Tax=Magnetospirillum sp. UT-4 TaxID=2681467 RepID=UPI00137C5CB2|nr:heme biosynthesis HemY N-terminal domain-containing protein [Magnetospirillum sp. UT-4]CAA7622358.1 Putative protoheme IX synthesis protein -Conserved among Magnetospirillum sp [Magnetospirillum sp. UT-4]
MFLRAFGFLLFVSPVVLLTLWFSDNAGVVQVEWLGWHVDTNVPVLLCVLLVLFLVLSGLSRLSMLVVALPGRLGRSRQVRNRERGMAALLEALELAGTGDPTEVRHHAAEAAKLLESPELAARLDKVLPRSSSPRHQSAAEDGEPAKARSAGRRGVQARMHESPPPPTDTEAELAKLRAIVERAHPTPPPTAPAGDLPPVRQAEPAPEPQPQPAPEPAAVPVPADASDDDKTAFAQVLRQGAWGEAAAWLDLAAGRLPAGIADRWRVLARVAEAQSVAATDAARAAQLAGEALALNGADLAAWMVLLESLVAQGDSFGAADALARSWRVLPNRVLPRICASLWPDETPEQRLARCEAMAESHPHQPDAHLVVGEAAVLAQKWGVARRHLMAVLKAGPDGQAARLMAEVEDREPGGSARAAEVWRQREHGAPAAPTWVCGQCGASHGRWSWECPKCSGLDRLAWGRPAAAIALATDAGADTGKVDAQA